MYLDEGSLAFRKASLDNPVVSVSSVVVTGDANSALGSFGTLTWMNFHSLIIIALEDW
jgi:hypothetical protein